jgi:plastocyanin
MTRRHHLIALVTSLLLLVAVTACGGSDGEQTDASSSPTGAALTIKSFKFSPTPLKVDAGATVDVTNADGTNHTVTADDGSFDTKAFDDEKSFTAPSKPGTYAYHCDIHDYMKGVIQVGS